MAEKAKVSDKDKTLVNILERLAGELQKQGAQLDDIIRRQNDFSGALRSTEYQLGTQQNASEKSIEKIRESIAHYRSGMLSLVNEQDQISEGMKEVRKLVGNMTFSIEGNNKRLEDLDGRLKAHEKAMREHYEHSQKQGESIPKEIAEAGRNVAKLHADTEKRLGELHRETQRQLEKINQEISRRLLALSGIEAALDTLLIRTAPPEKKPLLISRVFVFIGFFFRVKLPLFLKKVIGRPIS